MTTLRDELQAALGERYVILRELNAGMARVFVARETALDRDVVLKVLPPDASAGQLLERFRREISVAARLQHPHILPVLTAGEVNGSLYYTMPYVPGESLRERLKTGQIGLEETTRLAREIADALEYAHGQGVVHRDVKPDNILLSEGHALLTDFGIAKAIESSRDEKLTGTGISLGTPLYMAPEQAAGATDVDARADTYALGCVVYELLTGQAPFNGRSAQAIVAQHFTAPFPLAKHSRADLPPGVDAALQKATAKSPQDRWKSVREFSQALQHAVTVPGDVVAERPRNRTRAIVTGGVLVLLALASAAAWRYAHTRATLSAKDSILVADFVNTTGDSVFDGALAQALRIQLRQTPFLTVFPDEGVAETLKLMARPADTRITREIGREICQRQGVKAMIVGSIAKIGGSFQLTVEALSAASGDAIASQQAITGSEEGVLTALQKASTDLRQQLGESLRTIQLYNAPIEQATTSSLPALSSYSKGLEQIYRGNSREALPLFSRAIELDPKFASAYSWLSWTYANLGDNGGAAVYAGKAYALRDRTTELERLRITDAYYLWVTGEWTKQYDVEAQLERLYPNDWLTYNNRALGYMRVGQWQAAVNAANEAIKHNPNEVHPYWHGAFALFHLSRYKDADALVAAGRTHHMDHSGFRSVLFNTAFARDDSAAVGRALGEIRSADGEAAATLAEAREAAFEGRWNAARSLYGRFPSAVRVIEEGTLRSPLFEGCNSSAAVLQHTLALNSMDSPRTVLWFPMRADGSMCGDTVAAKNLAAEQQRKFPNSIVVATLSVPLVQASVALTGNDPQTALAKLAITSPNESGAAFGPNYLRGQAYLRLKNGAAAQKEFQQIIDHRGWDPMSPLYPLAYLGAARAAVLAGNRTQADSLYQNLMSIWKTADHDLPIYVSARAEAAVVHH